MIGGFETLREGSVSQRSLPSAHASPSPSSAFLSFPSSGRRLIDTAKVEDKVVMRERRCEWTVRGGNKKEDERRGEKTASAKAKRYVVYSERLSLSGIEGIKCEGMRGKEVCVRCERERRDAR